MSSSAFNPKTRPPTDYSPCGALGETMKRKLEKIGIHPLHNTSGGRKYSVSVNDPKNTVIVNIYNIEHTKTGSKTTVTIDKQITYVILCDKGTFFTAGVSDAEVTTYLKEEQRLRDITGKSHLGGRRRSKRRRLSTKRRRSTRKN